MNVKHRQVLHWKEGREGERAVVVMSSMALHRIGHQSHCSLLGPIVFIMYINEIKIRLGNIISEFADDTKIRKSLIDDRGRLNLQKDLRKI